MSDFVPLAAAAGFVWRALDVLKFLRNGDTNGWVTQLAAWALGVGAAALLAASDFGAGVEIGNVVLADAKFATLVLIGVTVFGTGASAIHVAKTTLDSSDSAKTPPLVGP